MKGDTMRSIARFAGACLVAGFLFGAGFGQERPTQLRLDPRAIESIPTIEPGAGTSGLKGIRTRVLKGDPTKPGLYTIQLTVPANTRIEAHDHPDDRIATIVSGTWYFGYGNKFDEKSLAALPPGSVYSEPPSEMHFARTGSEPVVILITGIGPTGTKYYTAGPQIQKGKP